MSTNTSFKPVLVQPQALADLFLAVQAQVYPADGVALADVCVTHVAPLDLAGKDAFAFLSNPKWREQLLQSRASVIALTEADDEWLKTQEGFDRSQTTLVVCRQPYALFAMVAQRCYLPSAPTTSQIHPTAVIADSALLGQNVHVGAYAVVEAHAQLGDGVVIESGVRIGAQVSIGAQTRIYPNVTVYHGCEIGQRCIIHAGTVIGSDGFGFAPTPSGWQKIPQVGRVMIGHDVEIGANTTIDRGALTDTVIEDDVKIDNLVQIAHNCVVGAHSAIAACAGIAGSTIIGKSCMIGGAAMLGGHLSIADHTVVSGGTAITSDVTTAGQYTGVYPTSTHREWERNASLIRHLADLRKRIRGLERVVDKKAEHPADPV